MDKDRVKNTGIIGLGAMGYQMARHMVNKGFAVTGYDVAPEAAKRAKEAGHASSSRNRSAPTSRARAS